MLDISCAFATSMATPDHVATAEALGYKRAWLYDSPALYPDVWMILAECARRTSTIEIGPGVAIPSLRHPMVTAAAVATLTELAPGRVNLALGSGSPDGSRWVRSRWLGHTYASTSRPWSISSPAARRRGRARRFG